MCPIFLLWAFLSVSFKIFVCLCVSVHMDYSFYLTYLSNHPGKGGCENGCGLAKNVPAQLRDTNHTHDTLIPRTHIHASIPTFSAVYTGSRVCTHEVTPVALQKSLLINYSEYVLCKHSAHALSLIYI